MFRLILILLLPGILQAQITTPTPASERLSSVHAFDQSYSMLDSLKYENIGPTVFSGRVSDIAVDPADPHHFYVAYASGGLWETTNNGTTFSPIFDHQDVMTIGAIAVNWTTKEIWVGTGEVNSSRSSYAGLGMYKSNDNGKNWAHLGLEESHHIGRVILHPTNAEIAWVAVLGHLYSTNPERGVYKTIDGGQTWIQTLTIDEKTGVVDLILDPSNPDILYASAWERSRSAWNFVESGAGSGIYKSVDGGSEWAKISGGSSGFPDGEGTGRIGLSISTVGNQTRIYALLDNYNRRPTEEKEDEDLVKNDFKSMSKEDLLALDDEKLNTYLRSNRFPEKYKAEKVKKMVKSDEVTPSDLATYLENANALLFDTPVTGAELYKSDDGGKSWTKTHEDYLDGVYFSYGYYFGVIRSDPGNPEQVYIAGVPILRSDDGGKNFKNVNGQNVHVDHHVIWINPDNPKHIINGNDGGINISYDFGDNWIKCNSPSVGQFYYINVDYDKPYNVYGGTQDNGVWKGSHNYRSGVRWHNTGQYPYKSVMGGDGMQVQIDPRDNNTIYSGFQFGNYFRINAGTGKRERITPRHELGQSPYRWNWQTPIHLSVHQPDILYMGAHKLFRSFDQGKTFLPISDDLTQGGKKGDVPYGTLATIHESPLEFGLIYTGSDDGLIHVSRDGGHQWEKISDDLPQDLWVSRIQASSHEKSRVYVSLNGYRNDDFTSYIYVSEDYGQHWSKLGNDLPAEPVNVIKEDPEHENILYVGTDRGVYISIDMGQSFMRTGAEIPNVPVHDLVVQSEAKDLLIGTHGRSIYRADLEGIYAAIDNPDEALVIIEIPSVRYNKNLGNRSSSFREFSKNHQTLEIYVQNKGIAALEVRKEGEDNILYQKDQRLNKGINYMTYDLSLGENQVAGYLKTFDKHATLKKAKDGQYYLLPGKYEITINQASNKAMTTLEIKDR